MPEVGEVAHAVAQLRRNVIGYRIEELELQEDHLLFPFLKDPDNTQTVAGLHDDLLGSTLTSVGRHGKYFWIRLEKNAKLSVLVMHFGMTGWIKLRGVKEHMVFMEGGGDKAVLDKLKREDGGAALDQKKYAAKFEPEGLFEKKPDAEPTETWPPRFSKLSMTLVKADHSLGLSFVDPRRLGRVRHLTGALVQTDESLVCNCLPLRELGPDYLKDPNATGNTVVKAEETTSLSGEGFVAGDPDPDPHGKPRLSLAAFEALVLSKKKVIKSLLLDQTVFAGIGNWMADEICFQARIHPNEIMANVVDQIPRLYECVIQVCETAVEHEAEVVRFPKTWLMPYRWGKRRKNEVVTTFEGFKVEFVTIGGRTSCFVPEVQGTVPLSSSMLKESPRVPVKRKAGTDTGPSKPKDRAKKTIKLESREVVVGGYIVEEVTLRRSGRHKPPPVDPTGSSSSGE